MNTAYKFPWDAIKAEWPEQVAAIDRLVEMVRAKPGTRYLNMDVYANMNCTVVGAFADIIGQFIELGFLRLVVVSTVTGNEFNSIVDMPDDEVAVNTMDTIKIYYEVL